MLKIGQRFGRLTLVGFVPGTHTKKRQYLCVCDCGGKTKKPASDLTSGNTSSCGCFQQESRLIHSTKHGQSRVAGKTREFNAHQSMKARCYNPKSDMYHNYGGRGISVCARWLESFINFYLDMGDCPPNYTLERKDVNGDYGPDNCKWASILEQAGNKRNNVYGYWYGVKYHMAELKRITGMCLPTIKKRIVLGIPLETPVDRSRVRPRHTAA